MKRDDKLDARTALWFQERKQCLACSKCIQKDLKSGDATVRVLRCNELVIAKSRTRGYCIDMREPEMPCGPNATLFQPTEKSK